MRTLYAVLKIVVNLALWVYFPVTQVRNRKVLRFKGPAIVVSNHPNTLMDVLNIAARAREQFFFLANASIFKSRFGNWFFNTMYCIPIERTLDTDGKPLNNNANFARAERHMEGGGTLYIAPEGTSWMKRHLHPLKTGTARIALGAESKNNYQLDLKIVPVGLNYSAPTDFRSRLFINVGEPLYVRDFRESYAQNPVQAVREATAAIETRLRPLMLDTRNDAEDALVLKLQEILQNDHPVDLAQHFDRSRQLITQLQAQDSTAYHEWQQETENYFKNLKSASISDYTIARAPRARFELQLIAAISGLPVFLYGYFNNFLPAWIPAAAMRYLQRKANLYIGYTSTVKFSLGVFLFPFFYWLQSEAVEALVSKPASWWYLLSLPITGLFAADFQPFIKRVIQQLRWHFLPKPRRVALKEQRANITNWLSSLLAISQPKDQRVAL